MTLEEWYPVTSDMGLIKSGIEQTVSELVQWHGALDIRYIRSEVVTNLAEALNALPPLSAEMRRRLFVATRAGWTACFQSGTHLGSLRAGAARRRAAAGLSSKHRRQQ